MEENTTGADEVCENIFETLSDVVSAMAGARLGPVNGVLAGEAVDIVGEVVCEGRGLGMADGPAPSYLDGKLGFTPGEDAVPSFEMPDQVPASDPFSLPQGGFDVPLQGDFWHDDTAVNTADFSSGSSDWSSSFDSGNDFSGGADAFAGEVSDFG